MKKLKITRKFILRLLLAVFILFMIAGFDPRLETTEYVYENNEIPEAFDGFKICHISDLHCKSFGKNNETLLSAIKDMEPDIVVLTGDIVDEYHSDIKSVEHLLKGLKELGLPSYYVSGNHDLDFEATGQYAELCSLMELYGITDLDNRTEVVTKDDDSVLLNGLKWYDWHAERQLTPADPEGLQILLYHGTDSFDAIKDYNYDLILAGHVHGGIIRIPFINKGILGPSIELFPKYTSGVYTNDSGDCTMISSRGLGFSVIPRFYNRPELVCITLKR